MSKCRFLHRSSCRATDRSTGVLQIRGSFVPWAISRSDRQFPLQEGLHSPSPAGPSPDQTSLLYSKCKCSTAQHSTAGHVRQGGLLSQLVGHTSLRCHTQLASFPRWMMEVAPLLSRNICKQCQRKAPLRKVKLFRLQITFCR